MPDFSPQPIPIGNARLEHLVELQQEQHSFARVQAVAFEVVDELQLTGNVALAFANIAIGCHKVFLQNHPFHGPPILRTADATVDDQKRA